MASTFAYANSKTPYIDMYNDYAKQQKGIRDAYRKQIETDQTAAINSSNAEYDNTARQNYINYMQAQKRLPSELNAMGIRGGASESSLLRLGTNYGSNVASNEASRNAAIAALRQQYADKLASYDEEWDNKLQQAYLTAVENQLKWEQEQQEASSGYGGGGGGGGSRRSYGYGGGGGGYGGGGGGDTTNNNIESRWRSMTDYYAKNAANMRNYKNKRTTSGSKNNKTKGTTYHIQGESSKKWWGR